MTLEVYVSFSIKIEIVGVGWKYTYLRSPTLFVIEKKEEDQCYRVLLFIFKQEMKVRQTKVYQKRGSLGN